ncbi:unnamed protein product, partial [marine sediment metagenome]
NQITNYVCNMIYEIRYTNKMLDNSDIWLYY